MGCRLWGRTESDTTERLHFHFSLSCTGEGNGNPLQCSCLENPRDRGAWWTAVYGVGLTMFGAFLVLVDDLSLEKCSGFFPIFNMGVFFVVVVRLFVFVTEL